MRTDSNGMRRFWSLACALAMAMSLAGCDGSSSGYTAGAQATTEEYVGSTADNEAEAREDTSKESDEGTMVIKDASVSLRTRNYDTALETVRKIIAEADGTPVRSNETGGYGRTITIEATFSGKLKVRGQFTINLYPEGLFVFIIPDDPEWSHDARLCQRSQGLPEILVQGRMEVEIGRAHV